MSAHADILEELESFMPEVYYPDIEGKMVIQVPLSWCRRVQQEVSRLRNGNPAASIYQSTDATGIGIPLSRTNVAVEIIMSGRKASCGTPAQQCRELGIVVGDTIEGTEASTGYWHTARLTLIWLGESQAVWRMTSRSSERPEWSEPCEASNWTLSCREWRKIEVAEQ